MTKIAIFASGGGSNAEKIIEYFDQSYNIQVSLIISNRANAGVLEISEKNNIPSLIINRDYFYQSQNILDELNHSSIDIIVLAGFLWLIPFYLISAYPNRIINIHPALLPKYGGKGMYGLHVHQAVKDARESESGPTIHLVNEEYDKGEVLFQIKCLISEDDSASDIAAKVLSLEHQYFPKVIESYITNRLDQSK